MDVPADPPVEAAAALPMADTTKKQVRGSSLLLAGRVISLLINFVVQVMIVRYLSKADFGAFAYALSIVTLGQTVITLGLNFAITRFTPIYEERKEYDKIFGTIVMATGTILSLGLALVLLAFGLQGVLGGAIGGNERAVTLLLILIVLAPIQALDSLQTGMFAVFSKPRAIFFRKYLLAPSFRLVVVLLLVLSGSGVSFLAAGYVAAGAIGVAVYAVLLYREIERRGLLEHFHVRSMTMPWREVFAFTIPMLTTDLVYVVMNTSDAIILGHYGGADEVGAFRVIWPLAQMNLIVLTSFRFLYIPLAARFFAREDRAGLSDVYWGTAIWAAVLSFPIFALTFSLAEPLTVTLYGERYADSSLYLALLSLGYYVQAASGHNGITLKVVGLLKYIVTINVLAAAVNLAINLALIPVYGALGAAIGTCGTLLFHNVLKQWGLRRAGVTLFEWRYLRIFASILAAAAALLAIQLVASPTFVIALVLATAVSLAVLLVNRRALRLGHTFPELLRFKAIRLLIGE